MPSSLLQNSTYIKNTNYLSSTFISINQNTSYPYSVSSFISDSLSNLISSTNLFINLSSSTDFPTFHSSYIYSSTLSYFSSTHSSSIYSSIPSDSSSIYSSKIYSSILSHSYSTLYNFNSSTSISSFNYNNITTTVNYLTNFSSILSSSSSSFSSSTLYSKISSSLSSFILNSSNILFSSINSSYPKLSIYSSIILHSSFTSQISEKNICIKEEILENKCKEGKITEEQIEDIYKDLKDNIINKEYNNENTLIETGNAVFQLSPLDQQKNDINPRVSSVDLGECENIIKRNTKDLSDDDELIILKTDIRDQETKLTYVQYEIYHPYTLELIDLSICENNEISISVPVDLDQEIEEMNQKLNDSGYNLFDKNDSFYNDICTKYTTDSGSDINLNDRRNDIYGRVNNIKLCQKGCHLQYYDSQLKKSKCSCVPQKESSLISDLIIIKNSFQSNKLILEIFSKSLKYSNFMVLKCYKLAFNFKNFIYNYGCIIITFLFFFFYYFNVKIFHKRS